MATVLKRIIKRPEFDRIARGGQDKIYLSLRNPSILNASSSFDQVQFNIGDKKGREMLVELEEILKGEKYYTVKLGKVIMAEKAPFKIPYQGAPLRIMCRNQYGRNFLYFRKRDDLWGLFHNLVYEAYKGVKVPITSRVVFVDGDVSNCHPSNLEMIAIKDLRGRAINHDEFDLKEGNLVRIIEDHAEEIRLVQELIVKNEKLIVKN